MERDQDAVGGGMNVRLEIAIPEFDSVPKRPFGVLRMSARTAAMGEADGRLINEVRVQHGRDRTVGTVPGCVCRCGSPRSSLILVSCRSTRPCCGCRPCAQVHPSTSGSTLGCLRPGLHPCPRGMSRDSERSSTTVSALRRRRRLPPGSQLVPRRGPTSPSGDADHPCRCAALSRPPDRC